VFHNSELNAYNLADDIIEPLRPMVDMLVKNLELKNALDVHLGIEVKSALLSVLTMEMNVDEENVLVLNVCDIMAQSFVKCMKLKDVSRLSLPTVEKNG
jgi:CRISPR-associated protein Cas1